LPEPDAGHVAAWSGANDKSVHAQRFHIGLFIAAMSTRGEMASFSTTESTEHTEIGGKKEAGPRRSPPEQG
jgi:hypothetical protein